MIIYAEGFDRETSRCNGYFKIAIDSKDILYMRSSGNNNWQTVCFLKHNYTHVENVKKEEQQSITSPIWVVLNIPIEDVIKKIKSE